MSVVPTPRPTDGVDVYFEMPGDDSEHANFLRAKLDLEERRMKRINEVREAGLFMFAYKILCGLWVFKRESWLYLCMQIMKEWAEADNQSKNLPKSDRQALNEVKKWINEFLNNFIKWRYIQLRKQWKHL